MATSSTRSTSPYFNRRFLDWARKINELYGHKRSPTTNLFPSSEDRPDEMWYADVVDYACLLLGAADILGNEGNAFHAQALTYLKSYHRYAYDAAGAGIFDTINIVTGKPVVGPSRHYPAIQRPKYLAAWKRTENSTQLSGVVTAMAIAYESTGDEELRSAFDKAYSLMDVSTNIFKGTPMVAGDIAGVLAGLVHVGRRSGDSHYLLKAREVADHALRTHFERGLFTSGMSGKPEYYSARLGSGDLAAALLGYALSLAGRPDLAPPIRNPYGTMPW